jgi:hypothetical protein
VTCSEYHKNEDIDCKIPPDLPLPKGGIIPLFSAHRRIRRGEGKEGLGEIFIIMLTYKLLNHKL